MNKYLVTLEFTSHHAVEIIAESIEEAVEEALSIQADKHDHNDLEQTECLVIKVDSEDGEESWDW